LRDVTLELFLTAENRLPPGVFQHARHVVEEITRVNQAITLLEKNDAEGFGRLMFATHDSLRDLYEVSLPELDILVESASQLNGCLGARLTGAGFGGCTVNLVHEAFMDDFIHRLGETYTAQTGLNSAIFATTPSRGAHLS
jgi:galactokinase